jgi:regulator of protease activity HflC (stomatin/prohibitin superfamily)
VELAAEGKAMAAQKEAQGKAEAIKAVADAQAYEIEKALESEDFYLRLKQLELEEKRMEKWDGRYPNYLMNLGESGSFSSLILPLTERGKSLMGTTYQGK